MRTIARLSLAGLGLALALPISAGADDAPLSPAQAASPKTVHRHMSHLKGKPQICAKCAEIKAAKEAAAARGLPPGFQGGQIVGCAHSQNGVCKECRALLEMPGQITMVGSENPFPRTDVASAPGRAVASDSALTIKTGRAMVASGEPEPIGVMKTSYTPATSPSPVGLPAAPGRAMVESGSRGPSGQPGSAPFMSPSGESQPYIIGHLFGLSEMANDFHDWRASRGKKKRDAHAAIPYGQTGARVEELPASMVFGPGAR